jgi:hypothetical protein
MPSAGNELSIGAFMLSCVDREEARIRTLGNLAATDWGEPCRLVVDTATYSRRESRQETSAKSMLIEGIASRCSYILFLEDDLVFNKYLRHNLMRWGPLTEGKVNLASLYNPNIRRIEAGRDYFIADPEAVYGGQAFLISRECAQYVVNRYDEVPGLADIKISRLASRLGAIYYHTPSLVQHVGTASILGQPYHYSDDFDASYFSAP